MRYLICLLLIVGCSIPRQKVPLGTVPPPRQPSVSDSEAGMQALEAITRQYEIVYDHPKKDMLDRVIRNLLAAAGGSPENWRVYILSGDEVKNAAATRGNFIFFWTGMLDYTSSESELATVAAHEIAHVLARHTAPNSARTTTEALISIAAVAAAIATATATEGTAGSRVASQTAGALTQQVGKGIFVNPYSQEVETEADEIGLFLMARAGYNPEAALDFWNNFKAPETIAFFSTHPPAKDRLKRLKELLPLAKTGKTAQNVPPN